MTNFSQFKVGQTVAGLATALVLTVGVSAAHASTVTGLDAYNGSLDTAVIEQFAGKIDPAGTTSISTYDTYYGSSSAADTVVGKAFEFDYIFTLGTATTLSALVTEAPTTGISGFTLTLLDLSTAASVSAVGSAGTGTLGQLVLTASGLASSDTYDLQITGNLVGSTQSAGFVGSLSAVPLPGALTLFGSGLLGLAGLARRRRVKGAAALAAAIIAVPFAMTAGSSSASATTVKSTDFGVLPAATSAETVYLTGKVVSGVATGSAYYQPNGGNAFTNLVTTSANPAINASAAIEYQYDFTIAAAQTIDEKISFKGQNLPAADFSLVDLTTHTVVGTSWAAGAGSLELKTTLSSLTDTYAFVVDLPTTANTSINGTGTVSAVPVPGALFLFGSGLAGLAAFGRRARKVAKV